MNQYQLLKSRRFFPLFCTQFLGAFNDNVYKNTLVIFIVFQDAELYGLDSNTLVTLSAGIFILPYFLFSATAGQIADKYEKSFLIRHVKMLEIVIMLLAIIGFYGGHVTMLIILLFLLGTQATFFGPLKYAILPQHLQENELIGGNGLIQMGTFVAILFGMIVGGLLAAIKPHGPYIIAATVVLLAILGFLTSRFIPTASASEPTLKIRWNIIYETWHTLEYSLENRSVFIGIVGISWFWFVGATYLSQVPAYAKDILGGNEHVVTLLLTMFSIGIGLGSILCEKLSMGRIELGLVPLGAIGITLSSIDTYFASQYFVALGLPPGAQGVWQLLVTPISWRVLMDLLVIGLGGGFFIVPLYAMVQQRSNPEHRARIIAANNILNALLMVLSSIATVGLLQMGFAIPLIFLSLGLLSIVVSALLFLSMPEFIQRLSAWLGIR